MFRRQTSGAVVCRSCGRLVGVDAERCGECGARNPGLWGYAPALRGLGQDLGFSKLILFGCGALYLAMLATGGTSPAGGLSILSPTGLSLFEFGASGVAPVVGYGRWWTPLSAGWLHANLLHIGFNMWWLYRLAPMAAEAYGAGRAVVIYTLASVGGFVVSTFGGLAVALLFGGRGGFTVGASAAILGLLGALVYYGRRTGSSAVQQQMWSYALFLILFGFLMRGVDNWAHVGGFAAGYLAGRLFDPLKPERPDHMLMALVCLAATVAAVAASLLVPVR